MRPWVVIAITTCVTSPALADTYYGGTPLLPPAPTWRETGYFGISGLLGVDHFLNAAFVAELGFAISPDLWLRTSGALGGSTDFDGSGNFHRVTLGVEGRRCAMHGGMCAFGSLDAGYEWQTWRQTTDPGFPTVYEHHHGVTLGPRIGIDVGGKQGRLHGAMAVYGYDHRSDVGGGDGIGGGLEFTGGFVFRF